MLGEGGVYARHFLTPILSPCHMDCMSLISSFVQVSYAPRDPIQSSATLQVISRTPSPWNPYANMWVSMMGLRVFFRQALPYFVQG